MHADPAWMSTPARAGFRSSWAPAAPAAVRPQPQPPEDPAGAALVTVLARRLRGMSAVLAARAAALGGEPNRHESNRHELRRLAELDEAIGRLDRYCDSLLALAGVPFGRPEPNPVDLLDLLAASASMVERNTQVELGTVDGGVAVSGWVAEHAQHALAELLDNATFFSPPGTPVTLHAWLVDGGLLVRVVDRGVGIGPVRLAELNTLLRSPPGLHPDVLRASGLPVVAVLAGWYGWTVRLDSGPGRGTVAELLLPRAALAEPPTAETGRPVGGSARLVGEPSGPVGEPGRPAVGHVPPAAQRANRPGGDPRRRPPVSAQRGVSADRAVPVQRAVPGDRAVPGAPATALPRRQRPNTAAVPAGREPPAPVRDPVATAAALAAYHWGRPPAPPTPVAPPAAHGSPGQAAADGAQGTTDSEASGR